MPDECYVPEVSRIQTQDDVNHQASSGEQIKAATAVQTMMRREQAEVFQNYKEHLEAGTAREIARVNLPLSTYTQWYWKMDLHNLLHFLGLRMHSHAQLEMQKYAEAIFELIKPIVPVTCEAFEDYRHGAVMLSRKELEIVKNSLRECDTSSLNKRERAEFCEKIGL